MQKKKIAIYSGVIPSTTFIERLITGLSAHDFDVLLFGKYVRPVTYEQSSITVMGNRNGVRGIFQFMVRMLVLLLLYPGRFAALKKYLGYGPLSGKNEFVTWQKYVPVLLRLPDIFHLQWAKAAEEWLFLKELFGVKLVLSLRGTHINTSPLADGVLATSYRKSFKHYNAFHGVSHAIVKEAVQYGVDESKARVIYSGLPYRSLPVEDHSQTDTICILAVGRFHWKKGYHYLLDALKILKTKKIPFRLTLIAQGELPEELFFQLHDLNLTDEVDWIKGLPYYQVEAHMLKHDVLVLPSVEEGIANVVLEAMQLGLPVVSADCGGMDEAIVHGQNGFLVPVRNPEALAESLMAIRELSQAQRNQLRQQAHQTISEKFNLEKNIHQFVALYERIQSCA